MKTTFKKEEILSALKVKLGTELYRSAVGESCCEDIMGFIKLSPAEDFTRAETDFLVNNAITEVFIHGGRAERVKLSRVLRRACWIDISDKEIGLVPSEGALPAIF